MADRASQSSTDGGAADRDVAALFKLLDDFCTLPQLRALIRVYRPKSADYPISVTNDVALKLVLRLYNAGHLPRQRVEELLERAEENGRQHVFFYVPKSKLVRSRLSDFAAVESSLLGGRTRRGAGLPKFQVEPKNIAVADLRHETRENTRYSAWVYKLYAGTERWVLAGEPVVEGDEKTVRYRRQYRRDVLVAKWHSFGLLEIRIPIGPKQMLVSARDHLSNEIEVALNEIGVPGPSSRSNGQADEEESSYFAPLDLSGAMEELNNAARDAGTKWLTVSGTDMDVDGVKFHLGVDDEYSNIYASKAAADLVQSASETENKTERLRVAFHLRQGTEDEEKFNVDLCGYFDNEVKIGARTSPEAVEFMVRRIWEHSRQAELPVSPVDAMATDEPTTSDAPLVDFDTFALRHPALAAAVRRLKGWIASNPTATYLRADQLRRALGTGLTKFDVAAAVGKFVEEGVLICKFRVRSRSSGRLSPRTFDSLGQMIEQGATDDEGEPIDLKEADVIPVYMPARDRPDPASNGHPEPAAGPARKAAG